MNAACRTDRYFLPASSAGGGSSRSVVSIVMPLVDDSGDRIGVVWRLRPDDARASGARHNPRDVSERADRRTLAGLGGEAGRGLDLGAHGTGRELIASQFLRRHPAQPPLL